MAGDHGLGHVITGGIGVEAAVKAEALCEQRGEPGRVGSGPGGGEAEAVGIFPKHFPEGDGSSLPHLVYEKINKGLVRCHMEFLA